MLVELWIESLQVAVTGVSKYYQCLWLAGAGEQLTRLSLCRVAIIAAIKNEHGTLCRSNAVDWSQLIRKEPQAGLQLQLQSDGRQRTERTEPRPQSIVNRLIQRRIDCFEDQSLDAEWARQDRSRTAERTTDDRNGFAWVPRLRELDRRASVVLLAKSERYVFAGAFAVR